MINNTVQELMERLKQRTLQYAQEHGVVLGNNGFIQCLFPDHDDHDPSMHYWEENNIFFCFGCLDENEDIFTYEKGYLPIKDVEVGMTTIGLNGQQNRILHKQKLDGTNKKMFGIKTGAGSYLTKVTEEHKHFVINYKYLDVHRDGIKYIKNYDNRIPRIEFRKKELEVKTTNELQRGDYLFIPKTKIYYDGILYNDWKKITNKGIKPKIIEKIELNEDLCWLFGIYLAEGSLYRGGVRWTLGGDYEWQALKIKKVLEDNLGLKSTIIDRRKNKNIFEVTCSCTDFNNFIKKYFGERCDEKFIHPYFLHIDYKLQQAILDGLYDGDGTQELNRKTTLCLANKNIINAAKIICVNNNISFAYSETPSRTGNDGILRKPIYTLCFRMKETGRFIYDKLDNGQEGAFILIEEIKELESSPIVYDLTTDDNSFLTKNFITHNCGRMADIYTLANIFEGKPLAGPDFIEENVFYLAEKYGEPYEHLRKSMTPEELKRQSYFRTMKLFSDYVTAHKNNQYLLDRKISEDTAKRLNIGGVQDYNDCINYLIKAGCQKEIINEIGILQYKVNADQLIFIIKDEFGRPVSFVSRNMKFIKGESKFPKYNNGTETMIFNKSKIFYCWSDIKNKYNSLETLVIVEGYIDAVTAYEKGYTNIVALGSASFTDEHIRIIERDNRIKNVAIALDNDATGKSRMNSMITRLKNNKTTKDYKFAVYKEDGKDIDEILNSIGHKVPLTDIWDFLTMFDFELKNLKDSLGENVDESALFDRFVGIISKTESPKQREEQARSLAKYLTQYSYKTILDEVEYITSEEKIRYKEEVEVLSKRAFMDISKTPEYTLEIIDTLKEDIVEINKKYDKVEKNIFERGLENLNKFDKEKMNSDLYQIEFGIPALDDLALMPGHSVVVAAHANTGKSSYFQALSKNIALNTNNGVVFYISTDDAAEKIYDNLTAQITGLPRDYCENPFFHRQWGLNSKNPKKEEHYKKYLEGRKVLEQLIENKRLIVLDVKDKVDNWNGLKKMIQQACNYKIMEKMYKIMIIDSVNKIQVDGITNENETAAFLSANIKKLSERNKILSFLNFEINKMKNNAKMSQFNLSGSRRMFYDCNVLIFLYNPTRNLQEYEGTEEETKLKWYMKMPNGQDFKQPLLFGIQEKSKCGNNVMNARPYFYKLNEFTSELTPINPSSQEHNQYEKIWMNEWRDKYVHF